MFETLRSDFASFADPHTPVELNGRDITWIRSRQERHAVLVPVKGDYPDIRYEGEQLGYRQFFASTSMADLRSLAETMVPFLTKQPAYVGDSYVDGRASFEPTLQNGEEYGPASDLFRRRPDPTGLEERTKLFFLRGRAGDGKSVFLVHLSLHIAKQYVDGTVPWLYFYVNAQGSALARIDEVFAKVSQDLGSTFTYHAIPTLTRLGLIVPVIDGFDELLGVGGYKDAFSSLGLFLSRLGGRGVVVASARSTFYQYTDFSKEAARFASDDDPLLYEIVPVVLNPWTDDEAVRFLAKKGSRWSPQMVRDELEDRADEIISSPFLMTRLSDISGEVRGKTHFVRLVVEDLVEREMNEKLLDPQGRPLLSLDQHMELLGLLAEEMWWQEVREVDEQTFNTVAELQCEEFGLEGEVAKRFLDRVPSYALLSRTDRPVRIAFRHEFYFAFFLGERIGRVLKRGENINDFLRRATLSPVVAEEVAISLLDESKDTIASVLQHLDARRTTRMTEHAVNENAGTLIAAFIRRLAPTNMQGGSALNSIFNAADFSGTTLEGFRFVRSVFSHCVFRSVEWTAIEFDHCQLSSCKFDGDSRLEATGLRIGGDVLGVTLLENGQWRDLFSQREIDEALKPLGVVFADRAVVQPPLSPVAKGLVKQLNEILRVAEKTSVFSETDFKNRGRYWKTDLGDIVKVLRKHGLLASMARPRRGSRELYRLTEPTEKISLGEAGLSNSADIGRFWKELRSK